MVMMMMVIPIMWEDGWEVFGRVSGIQCTVFFVVEVSAVLHVLHCPP